MSQAADPQSVTIPAVPEQVRDSPGTSTSTRGDARISMVDARDVAAVAAKLTSALGRPVDYVYVPDNTVRLALLAAGLSEGFVGALVGLYQD